ncbi:response regulator transcription factor [Haladaptatus sp. ZSTT2]|uniref:response regulator transcription factor n=1 Tax=Haladaptatus sp. ZSTT2 TaxID=3120515 RepID=UPI00300F54F4
MGLSNSPVVLIVEDEPDIAEMYDIWLGSDYDTRLAANGEQALSRLDETVDVVLLDRRMPGMSGDEVLAEIRAREVDCRVAMVSAVDPDVDIVEMGLDEYVVKPPTKEGLRDTIASLLERSSLDAAVQEYYSLAARRNALEATNSPDELATLEEYQALLSQLESARERVAHKL